MQSPEEAAEVELDEQRPVAWLSQTTLSVDETLETVDVLRERLPLLIDPPVMTSVTRPRIDSWR